MRGQILAAAIVVVAATTATGQMYKWVDERGVTHYGEKPPPDRKAQVVGDKLSNPSPTAPSSAPDPAATRPEGLQEADDAFQRRRIAREQQAERDREAANKMARCVAARDELQRAQDIPSIEQTRTSRIYHSAAGRQRAVEQAQAKVDSRCN